MRRIFTWLIRIALIGAVLFAASLIWGRFFATPSTLMLARWATGQEVHRDWKPLGAISKSLIDAVIASEDQRYCSHNGVDFIALNEVLSDEDGPSRGASTITMQVSKNLYLWPGRSYLRKGLELPLALILDLAWGKRRVIEVYLNIAEWGDGIYGAEAASQHYYRKSANALAPEEASRLASALPNPITRHAERTSAASRRIRLRMDAIQSLADCVKDR